MKNFQKYLSAVAADLFADYSFLHDEKDIISVLCTEIIAEREKLIKSIWIYHRERMKLVFPRQIQCTSSKKENGITWIENLVLCESKFIDTSHHNGYMQLISFIGEHQGALILSHLLHMFRGERFIVERLSFLLLTIIAHSSVCDRSHLDQDTSFYKQIMCNVIAWGCIEALPLEENAFFVTLLVVLCGKITSINRFFNKVVRDLIINVSLSLYVPEKLDDETLRYTRHRPRATPDSTALSVLGCCTENAFFSHVNVLINRLLDNVCLFPHFISVILGLYRSHLKTLEVPQNRLSYLSADLVINVFLTRSVLTPSMFGTYTIHHPDPACRRILQQVLIAFRSLASMCFMDGDKQHGTEKITADLNIPVSKLWEKCNTKGLRSFIQQIIDYADHTVDIQKNENLVSEIPKSSADGPPSHVRYHDSKSPEHDSCSSLPGAPFLITATDLNILVSCLRSYVESSSDPNEELKMLLGQLPDQVIGSKLSVCKRETKASRKKRGPGKVNIEDTYQINYCGPGPAYSSTGSLPTAGVQRSQSIDRSRAVYPNYGAKLERYEGLSGSLGRSPGRSSSQSASPVANTTNRELVYTVYPTHHQNHHQTKSNWVHILSEEEFESMPRELGVDGVDMTDMSISVPLFNGLAVSNAHHTKPVPQFEQNSTGAVDSRNNPVQSEEEEIIPPTEIRKRQLHQGFYEQESTSQPLMDTSFSNDLLDALQANDQEDVRSNDPSSDMSERSNCTSLASSAHAFGRCTQLVDVTPGEGQHEPRHWTHNQHERRDADDAGRGRRADGTDSLLPTQFGSSETRPMQSSHSSHDGMGKHAHFSVSDFPEHAASCSRERSSRPGVDNQVTCRTRLLDMAASSSRTPEVLNRVGMARISSAELLRFTPDDEQSDSVGAPSIDPGRMGTVSSGALRCSSLNSLRNTGFELQSSVPVRSSTDQGSAHTSDMHEVDEQSSVRTCSSCGVQLDRSDAQLPSHNAISSRALSHNQHDHHPLDSLHRDDDQEDNDDESRHHLPLRLDEEVEEINENDAANDEDALSDLPMSSANVSGRVTPLSLTSSTSRGPTGTTDAFGDGPTHRPYSIRAGLVVPNGTGRMVSAMEGVRGSTGDSGTLLDFAPALLHRHHVCSSDVTEKFGKFDLPLVRIPEAEARSTVSDTWSTDVLPSDTEYQDAGSDMLGPDVPQPVGHHPSNSRLSDRRRLHQNRNHDHHPHHNHRHRHHRNRSDRLSPNSSSSNRNNNDIAPQADSAAVNSTSYERVRDPRRGPSDVESSPDHPVQGRVRTAFRGHSMTDGSVVTGRRLEELPRLRPLASSPTHTTTNSICNPTVATTTTIPTTLTTTIANALTVSMTLDVEPNQTHSSAPLTPLAGELGGDGASVATTSSTVNPLTEDTSDCASLPQDRNTNSNQRMAITTEFPWSATRVGREKTAWSVFNTPEKKTVLPLPSVCSTSSHEHPTTHLSSEHQQSTSVSSPSAASSQTTNSLSSSHSFNAAELECYPTTTTTATRPTAEVSVQLSQVVDGPTAEESVDEMMARYRRQLGHERKQSSNGQCTPDCGQRKVRRDEVSSPSSSHSIQVDRWFRTTCDQVRRGLNTIFSHPSLGPVIGYVIDDLTRRHAPVYVPLIDGVADERRGTEEDMLLLDLLQALLAESVMRQQSNLVTTISEVRHLLRLLMDATAGKLPPSLSECNRTVEQVVSCTSRFRPVAVHLVHELRAMRTSRGAFAAYLLRVRNRVAQLKRHVCALEAEMDQSLRLQCDHMVYNTVTAFLDSQLESFQSFLALFRDTCIRHAPERADNSPSPSPAQLLSQFVDRLLHTWNGLAPTNLAIHSLPVAIERLPTSMLCPRAHIERLVIERLYRSGVWMNDAYAERERDYVFSRELVNLEGITLSELQVPEYFHQFQPFHSVQDELRTLNASHVNPPRLLTNLAFLQLFAETLTEGEDQYIWCQFRAAVAEIRRLLSVLPSEAD